MDKVLLILKAQSKSYMGLIFSLKAKNNVIGYYNEI